jgi:hypothetical protein
MDSQVSQPGTVPPAATAATGTALMLHRDTGHLRLTAGGLIEVHLQPGSLRIFAAG